MDGADFLPQFLKSRFLQGQRASELQSFVGMGARATFKREGATFKRKGSSERLAA